MKKLILSFLLLFSVNIFGQVVNPETKKLPEFNQSPSSLPYVENSTMYHNGFKSADFLFLEKYVFLDDTVYYICYDNNNKKWVVFAVFLHKYNLWHINKKFIHLLKFN